MSRKSKAPTSTKRQLELAQAIHNYLGGNDDLIPYKFRPIIHHFASETLFDGRELTEEGRKFMADHHDKYKENQ